ncbi:pirin family protein [Pseudomonadota bacterium]
MLKILKAGNRGHTNKDGLDAYHTFSFADYYNSDYMGFRQLRAINEEWIQPREGYPSHSHKNMELIFYVIDGILRHKDSKGGGGIVYPGEIHRITTGTGVTHSEHNASEQQPVHLFHIWINPDQQNLDPSFQQVAYQDRLVPGQLCLLVSPDGREGSATIHQDVVIYICKTVKAQKMEYKIADQRHLWIQITKGSLTLNGEFIESGDGIAISDEPTLSIDIHANSEFLLFDLC